jgi:WG containing repeat
MKKLLVLLLFFPVLGSYSQKWEKNYDYVDNCVCGLSKVQKDGKVGYVDKAGVVVIKLQYDEGMTSREGYVAVRIGSKWQYLDSLGKAITEPLYDNAVSFSNGMAAVSKNNLYGYINKSGDVIIQFEFSNARDFTEGLAPASNVKGYWGFIDTKGTWAIKPIYDFTDSFDGGKARVIKGGSVFYIDKQNKTVPE